MKQEKKALTLKTISKSNVWGIQENDVFRIWEAGEKDADLRDNSRHYLNILKSAFDIEEIKVDVPEVIKKYEERGFKVGVLRIEDSKLKVAIKKHNIMRVSDLTYENIHHISATKLLEILDRNFGGGWDSLSQSSKDIIESGFDISTTTLPKDRLHKKGGMYDKKTEEGFETLEIPKGAWVEAIFAKVKPEMEKNDASLDDDDDNSSKFKKAKSKVGNDDDNDEDTTDDEIIVDDKYNDDDDSFDEDDLVEESYRTTFDADDEELSIEAEGMDDDDDY